MAKGGGAWKVAYADFVTAMMAFFLVMWIVGQDQQVRRSVSDYFNDPFNFDKVGDTKKPTRLGSVTEGMNTGRVPSVDNVSMGRGRRAFSMPDESSLATKLVNDWLRRAKQAHDYWQKQAVKHKELAKHNLPTANKAAVHEIASQSLSRQLKEETIRDITFQADGLARELLFEVIAKVNWSEIAEDFLTE